jgi:cobalt-zinc-cadmium efflux system membrane fusion protein
VALLLEQIVRLSFRDTSDFMSLGLARHLRSRTAVRTLRLLIPALALGCGRPPSGTAANGAPRGEVWLSPSQVSQAQIKVDPVIQQSLSSKVITAGRIAFDDLRVAHVFSPVTGRVSQIDVDYGQSVKKGDSLAIIDSPDLGQAYSDLLKAQADLTAAQHDVDRQRDLASAHAASSAQLEQSEDNFGKAKAEMERAELKIKLLRASKGDVVNQRYVLRSPIDGSVVGRNVNPGTEVQGMLSGANVPQELFTVGSIDEVWMLADLYENDLARAKPGDPVEIKTVSYPESFHGVVDYVSQTLDPTTRTARVRCTVDNADHRLKPEMYVTAIVRVGTRPALAVPRSALLRLQDQWIVFIQAGHTEAGLMRFVPRPVKVGDDEGDLVEITQGLEAGEQLVTQGAILLSSQV